MASGFFTCDLLEGESNGGNSDLEVKPDRIHCCEECCLALSQSNEENCLKGCSQEAVDDPTVCNDGGTGICSRRGINYFLGKFGPNEPGNRLFCCVTELDNGVFTRTDTEVLEGEECTAINFDVPTSFPTESPTNSPTQNPTTLSRTQNPTTPNPTKSPIIFVPTLSSNGESFGVISDREQQVLVLPH
eukprot:snap_masked-scaffold_62-processed-gene-0.25-mRNA-1 protein AED:1.00 eAED:1.00 QI:0/0/0/0/1/1/2/0/187